jgi:anaerobic ribonucleoside-triphosphate reductase activating protein
MTELNTACGHSAGNGASAGAGATGSVPCGVAGSASNSAPDSATADCGATTVASAACEANSARAPRDAAAGAYAVADAVASHVASDDAAGACAVADAVASHVARNGATDTEMVLRVSGITRESIVDGPGLRMTVFVQGCAHACPGCHNPQTHSIDGGSEMTCGEIIAMAKQNPLLDGLTFSGGEPFLQARALAALARLARAEGYDIVAYTGYTLEQLLEQSAEPGDCAMELLRQTRILIDGPYVRELRTLDVPFKGSSNQRVIDVAQALALPQSLLPTHALPLTQAEGRR